MYHRSYASVFLSLAGLLDYMVDFGKKEVTVRGKVVPAKKRKKHKNPFAASPSTSPGRPARAAPW